MSEIGKVLRMKRFKMTDPEGKVKFLFETALGNKYTLRLTDVSMTGLGGILQSSALAANENFEMGMLIPSSKITCETNEFTLGRLVLRRFSQNGSEVSVAFSTIDSRIPVDGVLSRYLEVDVDSKKSAYDFELNPERFSVLSFREVNQTNVDLFQKTEQFKIFFEEWQKSNKYQYYTVRLPSKGERVKLKQRRKGDRNDYLVASSNDYLGLASHPQVIEAAKKAIDIYGFGSTGSPVTTGLTAAHEELQSTLASLLKKDDVMLFNSGYTANIGVINALTNAQDLVVADVLAHASIQDAMGLSNATKRFYKHNDLAHLQKIMDENRASHYGSLVVTDGIFSMDGDVAPVDALSKVCRQNRSRLMVDEAHSFGVIGPTGLGAWEKFPEAEVDIVMGTFSKICGGIGGFVAAKQDVIDWVRHYSRAYIFTVAVPPSTAAAALAAIKLFQAEPERVAQLHTNINHFVKGLRYLGCTIPANHESPVIPVVIGDEKKLGLMNEIFRDEGIYVVPIVHPAVSRKQCRFRFTVMATHTTSDLDYILNVLEKAMLKANFTFAKDAKNAPGQEKSVAA